MPLDSEYPLEGLKGLLSIHESHAKSAESLEKRANAHRVIDSYGA